MKLSKVFLWIVSLLVVGYAIIYIFNHINPWLAIFIGIGLIFFTLKKYKL